MAKWIVHTKGAALQESFEIAVLREDNEHGIRSFGWFGPHKLLISQNGGPCRDAVTEEVWRELVGCAERIALSLNSGAAPHTHVSVPIAMLAHLAALADPTPVEVDGKTMVFENPRAAEVLRQVSAEVRALLDAAR